MNLKQRQLQLYARIQKGDEAARHEMIEQNTRLVDSVIAQKFSWFWATPNRHLERADLASAGHWGLTRAVDRWDPGKGAFSTIAVFWIYQSVQRAITETEEAIRLPENVRYKHLAALREGKLPDGIGKVCYSLDEATGGSREDESYLDKLRDESAHFEVLEFAEANERRELVGLVLEQLPEREARIVRWRYGFGGQIKTLEQVAALENVSRERIRQLETKALGRLRKLAPHLAP